MPEKCISKINLTRPPSCIQLFPHDNNAVAIGTYVLEDDEVSSITTEGVTPFSHQRRTGSLDILHIKDQSL